MLYKNRHKISEVRKPPLTNNNLKLNNKIANNG